jgi:hypothetical protein
VNSEHLERAVTFKAEIKAGGEVYFIELPEAATLEEAYEKAHGVAQGHELYSTPLSILDINVERYDHIRVWTETVAPVYEAVEEEHTIDMHGVDTAHIKYLGQQVETSFAVYESGSTVYALPFKVNGDPTSECLHLDNLGQLTQAYKEAVWGEDVQLVHVQPHDHIANEKEALDFVEDYAKEAIKALEAAQHTPKNATALIWKEDDEQ